MTTKNLTVPGYQFHKSSGQARVRLNGQDYYLGPYNSPESQAEYRLLVARWLQNGGRLPPSQESYTIDHLLHGYLLYARSYYVDRDGKPTKQLANIKIALRPLHRLYSSTLLKDFWAQDLELVRTTFINAKLATRTVNRYVSLIRQAFAWGVVRRHIPAENFGTLKALPPVRNGRLGLRNPDRILPVTDAVINKTLPYLTPVLAAMVKLMRLSGCRPGEICQLRPQDLDRTGPVWKYRPNKHKNEHHGQSRVILLGPMCQEFLRPYLNRDPHSFCFSPRESEEHRRATMHRQRKTPLNYGNRPGTNVVTTRSRPPKAHYDTTSFSRAIQYAIKKANRQLPPDQYVPHWHLNQLRHTYATEIAKEGGLEVTRTMLGHTNEATTRIYAEPDLSAALKIAQTFG